MVGALHEDPCKFMTAEQFTEDNIMRPRKTRQAINVQSNIEARLLP